MKRKRLQQSTSMDNIVRGTSNRSKKSKATERNSTVLYDIIKSKLAQLPEESFKLYLYPNVKLTVPDNPAKAQFEHLPRKATALRVFELLFLDVISKDILEQNSKLMGNNLFKFNKQALYNFIGVNLFMIRFTPRMLEDLWTNNYAHDGKEQMMSFAKFEDIRTRLKFDRQTIHSKLVNKFKHHATPGFYNVIDEIRIGTTNPRLENLNFNNSKPDRWALESRCASLDNKYLYWFTYPLKKEENNAYKALVALTEQLLAKNKNIHITADSKFGSLPQARKLEELNVKYTIACQSNHVPPKLWQALQTGLVPRRSHIATTNDNIVAASYFERAKLNLLSNVVVVIEDEKNSTYADRHSLLQHYDDTKRKSDQFNRMVGAFRVGHPPRNEDMVLFQGWMEFALNNSFILYSSCYNRCITHADFVLAIARELVYAYPVN